MNGKNNERIVYLDFIKFILIVLVIVCHSFGKFDEDKFSLVIRIINSFHMPLFFIISGFFIKPNFSRDTIYSDAKKLIVPYVITLLGCNLFSILKSFLFKENLIIFTSFDIYETYFNCKFDLYFVGAIWFLLALFWAKTILRFLLKYKYCYVFVMIITLVGYLSTKLFDLPFYIQQGMIAVLFLYIGYLIKNYKILKKAPIWSIPIISLVSIFFTITGGTVGFLFNSYPTGIINFIVMTVNSCLILMLVEFLSVKINSTKVFNWLSNLGKYTILILISHSVEFIIIQWKEIINEFRINLIVFILIRAIIIFIPIIVVKLKFKNRVVSCVTN